MSLSQNIAILGRQPELGRLELEAVFGAGAVSDFGPSVALVDGPLEISHLGGVLKTGEVIYRGKKTSLDDLPVVMDETWTRSPKTIFGVSLYGSVQPRRALIACGMSLKRRLLVTGPARYIAPEQGLVVSAAALRHNQVLEHGFELLILVSGDEMIVARTTGVQDIDWYSKRDYGRPARSAKVGMLPPKLAQIMISTTSGRVVCDPFCGTGVMLQEALLCGRDAVGSDLSDEMVQASRANLVWLQQQVNAPLPHWSVTESDARQVLLPAGCSIVTEGYLGPNMANVPEKGFLETVKGELAALYLSSLDAWSRQLTAGAEVTICLPAWRANRTWSYLDVVDEVPKLGYTRKSFSHVRSPLVYARDDQIVGRQLLLLRKI